MSVKELCRLIKSKNPGIYIKSDKDGSYLWLGTKIGISNSACPYTHNKVKHFDADFYDEYIVIYV